MRRIFTNHNQLASCLVYSFGRSIWWWPVLFTALHSMQAVVATSDMSVRPSVYCDKTNELVPTFLSGIPNKIRYHKEHSASVVLSWCTL